METNYNDFNNNSFSNIRKETVTDIRSFMSSVFSWMFLGLAITAVVAWYFAFNPNMRGLLVTETGISGLGWIVTFAPFIFVLIMGLRFTKLSAQTLAIMFAVFAILMGMSMSFILLVYTSASVFKTFAITSGMFGLMAVTGYTTKTDLTKFGSIMMMGLFGIILASVVNMFMHSAQIDYIISIIGVLVFTGLTAYDVQKLKRIGEGVEYGAENAKKLAIMGALTLYLDFINLFLFLLRFFGNRRN